MLAHLLSPSLSLSHLISSSVLPFSSPLSQYLTQGRERTHIQNPTHKNPLSRTQLYPSSSLQIRNSNPIARCIASFTSVTSSNSTSPKSTPSSYSSRTSTNSCRRISSNWASSCVNTTFLREALGLGGWLGGIGLGLEGGGGGDAGC